jgi:flagellar biosynthetic protein FliR
METLRITNTDIIFFLLIFFRIGAVLLTAPIFGSKNVPTRIRIVLACAIGIVVTMSFAGNLSGRRAVLNPSRVANDGLLIMAVFREVLLGIAIGYTARLTFIATQMAGQLVGMGMGFSMARIMDPSTRANVVITAQYNLILTILIFLIIRGHHYVLMAIAESFSAIPLAEWSPSASFVGHLNTVFAGIFAAGLRMALPVMGAGFLAKIGMAIIARTMPQMNVFIIGLPIQIGIGLIAMAVSLPFIVKVLCAMFISMRENVFLIFD